MTKPVQKGVPSLQPVWFSDRMNGFGFSWNSERQLQKWVRYGDVWGNLPFGQILVHFKYSTCYFLSLTLQSTLDYPWMDGLARLRD